MRAHSRIPPLLLLHLTLSLSGCSLFRSPAAARVDPPYPVPPEIAATAPSPRAEPAPAAPPRYPADPPPPARARPLPPDVLPSGDPVRVDTEPAYSPSPYGVDPIPAPAAMPESEVSPPLETLPGEAPVMASPEPAPDAMTAPPPDSPAFAPAPEPRLFSQSAPPAVLALETDIESDIRSGGYADAAASLERAIRIQPRNPELWHVLAEVRLKQNQPGLAEDLAKKSNLLAKNQAELIRSNWTLIAEARRLKGDTAGVMEALDKARW